MEKQPLVSVIIPTRCRPQDVDDCLQALGRQSYPKFEAIVVDASPDDQTRQLVEEKYPHVHYERFVNGDNQRPQAKNIGIGLAKGQILAFIDDDSVVQEGWMQACVDSYTAEDIGGVGGFIIEKKAAGVKPREDDYVARVTFNGTRRGNFDIDKGETIEVEHLRGCNMSFSRAAVAAVRGFDVNYIGSNVVEETDFCIRVRQAGFKILYNPKMRVIHTAGMRQLVLRDEFNTRRQYYITRNSTYFMLVNYNLIRAVAYILTNNTSIPAFVRKPEMRRLKCVLVGIGGKAAGFWAGLQKRLLGKT